MKRKRAKPNMVIGLVLLALACLIIFRLEILFMAQRMRLNQLGCGTEERVSGVMQLESLPPCKKLWAHRVNSNTRMRKLQDYFAGLETDVVFDATINNFRVYHPPARPADLLLDEYFKQIKTSRKGLWIDVKWIDSADYEQAASFFVGCDSLYGFREQIIIESSQIRLIDLLAAKGFITSYLVPGTYLQKTTPAVVVDSIKNELSPLVKFVSQEDIYLPALKSVFQNRKVITWALSINNYVDLSHLQQLINDTCVSVVLINCKSKGHL